MTELEFLKLSKPQKIGYQLLQFFAGLPGRLWGGLKKLGMFFVNLAVKLWDEIKDICLTFKDGDWKTRLSYVVMGFGSAARGQVFRGILFFLFQTVFNMYMIFFGGAYLAKFGTLGTVETTKVNRKTVYGDNSFLILLYGILTIFFIIAAIYTWRVNIKQNKVSEQILKSGKKLKGAKDDIAALADTQFHKTLLSLPMIGIFLFTIVPIIFMVLVAFTNYDYQHQSPAKLFTWVGLENFRTLLSPDSASYGNTFGQVLLWTLIWAFFATFLNYFLGMLVAIMINKKGIKLKKMWRTIFVMTIAIPQFVSLLYVSKMFAADGIINSLLMGWGWIKQPLPFWTNPRWAQVTVIIINIWIGIPYLMLIATGILMNIPADLYESARIDGANAIQTYSRITLPYMLFVTGPYLLTSFIGNINNFNVIFLLTQGKPDVLGNSAGSTDLLITWLYAMTVDNTNYKMAACIGIIVFVVCAVINLVVYNLIPSVKNEEDFQ
ncbi:MAG: sugar ABC transporter permease [Clostridiales bacterium]|nr:sugar ABC transporter permease [Clostridiales bacterium]